MSFNPYESSRYQGLGHAHYSSIPESALGAVTGAYIGALNHFLEVRNQVDENERKRQQWYQSMDGRLHGNARSALQGGLAADMANGARDCTGDNWNF